MAEDRIEVTHLMGKKLDKPIIMKWRSETKKNKMEEVARLFNKTLGEEFTVKYQIGKYKWCIEYHVAFTDKGLTHYGKSKDVILRQLLTGQAVIISD